MARCLLHVTTLVGLIGIQNCAALEVEVPQAYRQVAHTLHLPADQVYLAALSHSGVRLDDGCLQPWPWTVTVEKKIHHYPSRADAHAALLKALAQHRRPIKAGLLQLDVSDVSASVSDLLNPKTNLMLGLTRWQQAHRQPKPVKLTFTQLAKYSYRERLNDGCKAQRTPSLASLRSASGALLRQHIARLVARLAPRYTVDPALVMAVIAQESGFNQHAVSSKHAQGLMQLIPDTAQRFGVANPYDPEDNLRGGIAYLHFLLRHFQGDVALTLAGYNAGENAVDKYQGIPPFPETRQYVQRIMATYPRALHPVPPPMPS